MFGSIPSNPILFQEVSEGSKIELSSTGQKEIATILKKKKEFSLDIKFSAPSIFQSTTQQITATVIFSSTPFERQLKALNKFQEI